MKSNWHLCDKDEEHIIREEVSSLFHAGSKSQTLDDCYIDYYKDSYISDYGVSRPCTGTAEHLNMLSCISAASFDIMFCFHVKGREW